MSNDTIPVPAWPALSGCEQETLTAFPAKGGHAAAPRIFSLQGLFSFRVKGTDAMESIFLTTLLISVVIGVLIIYHVTPEG
jgi:hypothetical protein